MDGTFQIHNRFCAGGECFSSIRHIVCGAGRAGDTAIGVNGNRDIFGTVCSGGYRLQGCDASVGFIVSPSDGYIISELHLAIHDTDKGLTIYHSNGNFRYVV